MGERDVPEQDRARYRTWEDAIIEHLKATTGKGLTEYLGYHFMNEYWADALTVEESIEEILREQTCYEAFFRDLPKLERGVRVAAPPFEG